MRRVGFAGPALLLAGVLLFGLTWWLYRTDSAFARRAVRTSAVVHDVARGPHYRSRDGSVASASATGHVSLVAAGKTYRAWVNGFERVPKVGDTVTIFYDPQDPTHVVIRRPGTTPEPGAWVFGGIAVVLGGSGLILLTLELRGPGTS